jgi:Flp pilus assembly protein TadG
MKPALQRRRLRGSATIEFALVFIAVWAVLLLCWVAGNIAMQRSLIKNAARDAAMLVANATSSELASSDTLNQLEARAEDTLAAAIEYGGNQVGSIEIVRSNSISAYNPSLRLVQVSVEALVTEHVFDSFPFEHSVMITVEVPYGSRLAAP